MEKVKDFMETFQRNPSEVQVIDEKLRDTKKKIAQDFPDVIDGCFNNFIQDLGDFSKLIAEHYNNLLN